ncbi:unnamed protein product, partial [Effrenium voratum]
LSPERDSLRAAALEVAGAAALWADSDKAAAETVLQEILDEAMSCKSGEGIGLWLFNATINRSRTPKAVFRLLAAM